MFGFFKHEDAAEATTVRQAKSNVIAIVTAAVEAGDLPDQQRDTLKSAAMTAGFAWRDGDDSVEQILEDLAKRKTLLAAAAPAEKLGKQYQEAVERAAEFDAETRRLVVERNQKAVALAAKAKELLPQLDLAVAAGNEANKISIRRWEFCPGVVDPSIVSRRRHVLHSYSTDQPVRAGLQCEVVEFELLLGLNHHGNRLPNFSELEFVLAPGQDKNDFKAMVDALTWLHADLHDERHLDYLVETGWENDAVHFALCGRASFSNCADMESMAATGNFKPDNVKWLRHPAISERQLSAMVKRIEQARARFLMTPGEKEEAARQARDEARYARQRPLSEDDRRKAEMMTGA
jgi:hypothetical protein